MRMRRASSKGSRWFVLALMLGACGGSDPTGTVQPDPAVERFVGTWEASEFVITSNSDPSTEIDILEGGAFSINIQPSGQYTAILEFPGLLAPQTEFGQLTVFENSVRLNPTNGAPVTSSYAFEGPDRVTLDGPTEFDFNRDGEPEEGEAHIVLDRS